MTSAQQMLDGFAAQQRAAGIVVDVGRVLLVVPARSLPLDHAAIAWAHAQGLPAPPSPRGLAAELVLTTTGLAYATSPVPYLLWRRWSDVLCQVTAVRSRFFGSRRTSVLVIDRVAPFEARAVDLDASAARTVMDQAVQHGAVAPGPERAGGT